MKKSVLALWIAIGVVLALIVAGEVYLRTVINAAIGRSG